MLQLYAQSSTVIYIRWLCTIHSKCLARKTRSEHERVSERPIVLESANMREIVQLEKSRKTQAEAIAKAVSKLSIILSLLRIRAILTVTVDDQKQ
jgi:hypothetical protein